MSNAKVLLLLLAVLILPRFGAAISSCGSWASYDIMATAAFVDIYDTSAYPPVVLALSDGKAVFASLRSSNGNPRVVKVTSGGDFEWFSEQRVGTGDSAGYSYYPKAMAQDGSAIYLYLAGYVSSSPVKSFIIVYKLSDGSYVKSAFLSQSASTASYLQDMIMDSAGMLAFVGYYGSSSPWAGTVDVSTLVATQKTLSGSSYSTLVLSKIIQASTTYYVMAGSANSQSKMWIATVYRSSWAVNQECPCSSCSSIKVTGLTYANNRYGAVGTNTYSEYNNWYGSTTSDDSLAGVQDIVPASNSYGGIMVGYSGGASYAYYVSLDWSNSRCLFDGGQVASYSNIFYTSASKSSSGSTITWVTGYLATSPNYAFIAQLTEVNSVLYCSGYTKNYLNSACYTPVTATNCFGLCGSCLIRKNINGCYTGASSAHSAAISLFAGRCSGSETHYDATTTSCASVTQTSCHKLCGGECLAANDPGKCAHHCIGAAFESNIITTYLWKNICRCKVNMDFDNVTETCKVVTDCYQLCGSSGCGRANDASMCLNCVSTATTTTITDSDFVKCSCTGQLGLSSTGCSACYALCNGCILAANNTQCNDCIVGANINKIGTAAPYTCQCATQTALSGATSAPSPRSTPSA